MQDDVDGPRGMDQETGSIVGGSEWSYGNQAINQLGRTDVGWQG